MAIKVDAFDWDEFNLEHCPVSEELVEEVRDNAPAFFRNKKYRASSYMMIGPDNNNQLWTIALAETDRYGVWRPITGWRSEKGEITKYRNAKPMAKGNDGGTERDS